jgi:hypothetical protein
MLAELSKVLVSDRICNSCYLVTSFLEYLNAYWLEISISQLGRERSHQSSLMSNGVHVNVYSTKDASDNDAR